MSTLTLKSASQETTIGQSVYDAPVAAGKQQVTLPERYPYYLHSDNYYYKRISPHLLLEISLLYWERAIRLHEGVEVIHDRLRDRNIIIIDKETFRLIYNRTRNLLDGAEME